MRGRRTPSGATVVKKTADNGAPLQKVIVQPSHLDQLITADAGLKLYDLQNQPISFDGTSNRILEGTSKEFWVEGTQPSSKMRDMKVTVTPVGGGTSDSIPFTVLWVTLTGRFSGEISPDNASRRDREIRVAGKSVITGLWNVTVPRTYQLGTSTVANLWRSPTAPDRYGMGMELIGTVSPADYDRPVLLDRDQQAWAYVGPAGQEALQPV